MIKAKAIQFLFESAWDAAKRFPLVLLAAILATGQAILHMEHDIPFRDSNLVFTFLLGIPLFLSLNLFLQSKNLWSPLYRLLAGIGGALLLFGFHWAYASDTGASFLIRYFHASLALHLLVSFSAFINSDSDASFWEMNKIIFLRVMMSALYAAVFFVGLVIAMGTIDKLFDTAIEERHYAQLWFISAFLLQTWYFLAGLPKGLSAPLKASVFPKALKFFVQYLLIPLVSVYIVILYVYMAKIFVTQSWPQGYIGWLVSAMSVLGIFNLLLIDPERKNKQSPWIATYSRLYYILILPLLMMLFIAIGKRISEYGLTEKRYFLVALGVLLFGLALYFIFSKKKNIKVIPVSLFFAAIFSFWGPWGAYQVSLKSQHHRAEKILQKNGLLVGGKIVVATSEVSEEDQRQLSSIFNYILRNHGAQSLSPWLPRKATEALVQDPDAKSRYQNSRQVMEFMGLNYFDSWQRTVNEHFHYRSSFDEVSFDISNFRAIANMQAGHDHAIEHEGETLIMELIGSEERIEILNKGEVIATFPLENLVKIIGGRDIKAKGEIPRENMLLQSSEDSSDYWYLVSSIVGKKKNGSVKVTRVTGYLLIQ